jgi:hypothetical protein
MKIISGLFLLFLTASALAQENYVTNIETLYPPGCATNAQFDNDDVQGEIELIQDGTVLLVNPVTQGLSTVLVAVYRQGCAEENRAIIRIDMEVLNGGATLVPVVRAVIDDDAFVMRLTSDPNSFMEVNAGSLLFTRERRTFYLDGPSLTDRAVIIDSDIPLMTPEQYNGDFRLDIFDILDSTQFSVPVPAYENNLHSAAMPFNGRLSGNWVVAGVPDQGFVIAFEELPDGTNFVFVSWYTFDSEGNLLWLTAGDTYEIGDSSIDLPIELVTNGEFLGSSSADRTVVGTATLAGVDCNNLQFTFDLSQLGLGSGTVRLQRLFSLETAGYACRDQKEREARIND